MSQPTTVETPADLPSWHFCGGIPGDVCDCAEWIAECAAAFLSPLRVTWVRDENRKALMSSKTEQVFTFGYGQTCPVTGKELVDHYATIIAPDAETARAWMLKVFGQAWSFQYDSVDEATRGGQFPMREHVRIEVTA